MTGRRRLEKDVPKEIPETRLGHDFVGRKNAHAVDLGRGLVLGGQMPSYDLIFLEAAHFADV